MQESFNYEQAVVRILRELPPDRKAQVLDFAVFMRLQSQGLSFLGEPLTEERAMMLASIQSLAKYWDTPEEDEAWAYLQKATS
jgi:hypothetical protein